MRNSVDERTIEDKVDDLLRTYRKHLVLPPIPYIEQNLYIIDKAIQAVQTLRNEYKTKEVYAPYQLMLNDLSKLRQQTIQLIQTQNN